MPNKDKGKWGIFKSKQKFVWVVIQISSKYYVFINKVLSFKHILLEIILTEDD